MTNQLILQFETSGDLDSFDKLCRFEEELSSEIGHIADVDGHDLGSGEMNIFILTDQPVTTFELVKQTQGFIQSGENVKVAYRLIDGEDYVLLWPAGLEAFHVE